MNSWGRVSTKTISAAMPGIVNIPELHDTTGTDVRTARIVGAVGAREVVAEVLHRSGALSLAIRLPRLTPLPQVRIVSYHHVADPDPDYPYDPEVADATSAQFRRQMETLNAFGTTITTDDLVRSYAGEPLPKNPVMITFDDGYLSCHDTAMPILRSLGMRATFFIATAFTSQRRLFWWEKVALALSQARRSRGTVSYPEVTAVDPRDPRTRRWANDTIKNHPLLDVDRFVDGLLAALDVPWSVAIEREHADRLIMTWDHVRALAAAGMDVQSHTRNHRVLRTLASDQLHSELAGSRADIEEQLGKPIYGVAYPVGRSIASHPELIAAVKAAGYKIGFTNTNRPNWMWPRALAGLVSTNMYNIGRMPTDRDISDSMWLARLLIPRLAHRALHTE